MSWPTSTASALGSTQYQGTDITQTGVSEAKAALTPASMQ